MLDQGNEYRLGLIGLRLVEPTLRAGSGLGENTGKSK
jgi:hypothetical protein